MSSLLVFSDVEWAKTCLRLFAINFSQNYRNKEKLKKMNDWTSQAESSGSGVSAKAKDSC